MECLYIFVISVIESWGPGEPDPEALQGHHALPSQAVRQVGGAIGRVKEGVTRYNEWVMCRYCYGWGGGESRPTPPLPPTVGYG